MSQPTLEQMKGKGANAPTLQSAIASLKSFTKTDITAALDKIEEIADNIDFICDAAEKDNDEITADIVNIGTIGVLLQMFASPCQEVMKLALSGLERLLSSEDLAIVAIEAGAFETFSNVFMDGSEPLYLRLKASSILVLMLISDFEKNLKVLALQNGVFIAHVAMINNTITSTSDTCESILRFLFAVTEDCPEAQEHLIASATSIGFLLDLVKQRHFQALGPLCNVLQLDGLKSKLPVPEIETLLVPLLNDSETEIDDLNYDRVVLIVSNLIDSEKEDHDTHDVLLEQLQDMAFAIMDGSLLTCGLTQVLSGINNLAVSDHNKLSIGNSDIPKVLMEILQREGPLVFNTTEDDEEGEGEKGRRGEGERGRGEGGEGSASRGDGEVEEEDLESKEIKALAAKIMWSLSFQETNRKKMEANGTFQAIQRLSTQGDNLKMKRNLEGCLWLFKHQPFSSEATNSPNISNLPNTANDPIPNSAQSPPEQTTSAHSAGFHISANYVVPSNNRQLETWTVEDVKQWLSQVNLGQYATIFEAQRIDGRALSQIANNICNIQFLEMVEKRLEFHLFGDLMGFVHAVRKHVG
eukprot:Phypoly_transcript_06266.p1 GENE.Phypoly_transcript_06266~~Phypoly_transcript_06266.p1  ORF type:complete len:583 (+),score=101.90 Phypoly_transcript_06266:57-1805(+)